MSESWGKVKIEKKKKGVAGGVKESGVKIGSGWRRSLVEGRPLTSEAPRAQRGRPQSHLVGDGCPVSLFGVHGHRGQLVRGWHCAAAT